MPVLDLVPKRANIFHRSPHSSALTVKKTQVGWHTQEEDERHVEQSCPSRVPAKPSYEESPQLLHECLSDPAHLQKREHQKVGVCHPGFMIVTHDYCDYT